MALLAALFGLIPLRRTGPEDPEPSPSRIEEHIPYMYHIRCNVGYGTHRYISYGTVLLARIGELLHFAIHHKRCIITVIGHI